MQQIPEHSLEEIERSRAEMAAFMNEKRYVWPDLTLTGEDIHAAFGRTDPIHFKPWSELSDEARQKYNDLARELNIELDARQAWFEGEKDAVTISAVRCSTCNEMLQAEHAEGHVCWLESKC